MDHGQQDEPRMTYAEWERFYLKHQRNIDITVSLHPDEKLLLVRFNTREAFERLKRRLFEVEELFKRPGSEAVLTSIPLLGCSLEQHEIQARLENRLR